MGKDNKPYSHLPATAAWLGWLWVLLLGIVPSGHTEESSPAHLKQRMQVLQKDIKQLQSWLQTAQSKQSKLLQELAASERHISRIGRQIHGLKKTIQQQQNNFQILQTRTKQIHDNLANQKVQLAAQLRQQYQLSQYQQGNMIFSLTDTNTVSRMMHYFHYLHQAQKQQIANYRYSLSSLNAIQQKQADVTYDLQQQQAQLQQQQAQLVQARQRQQRAVSLLQQEQQNKHQQLSAAEASKQQIQDLLLQLEAVLQKAYTQQQEMPFANLKGQLIWPVTGKVLNHFGRQQARYPLSEDGWLIKSQMGSSVQAVYDGQVVFANWLKGYGLMLIIDHGNGYLTLYGQNQSLYKEVGDQVSAGEFIASSGKSGGNQDAALYFSIRKDGQPLNPKIWLNQKL